MQAKLKRIEEELIDLRDQASDDELVDDLDEALSYVEAALDRLVAIAEEEGDDDEAE